VLVVAEVVRSGRQIRTRISRGHHHWSLMVEALGVLQRR
jgi:hypothetical protein